MNKSALPNKNIVNAIWKLFQFLVGSFVSFPFSKSISRNDISVAR